MFVCAEHIQRLGGGRVRIRADEYFFRHVSPFAAQRTEVALTQALKPAPKKRDGIVVAQGIFDSRDRSVGSLILNQERAVIIDKEVSGCQGETLIGNLCKEHQVLLVYIQVPGNCFQAA
ncbi:hypothetical protein PSEUDO8Z_10533 [Pseudomonas sp. 8Z]|nr:hypothetical protein PSEUDO8Z_10533 [Pseudomonas sp. 8Z]